MPKVYFILVAGDLFNNYCNGSVLITVARAFFAASMLITYPILCFVAREVTFNVLFRSGEEVVRAGRFNCSVCPQLNNGLIQSLVAHVVVTVGIVAMTTALSLPFNCLGLVLELNVYVAFRVIHSSVPMGLSCRAPSVTYQWPSSCPPWPT